MFGYVKVHTPSMRVREHELYRAVYCGLCRTMGKKTGQLSRFTLSYDLVFLAAVRILATGEIPEISHGRCMAHPLKKRAFVRPSSSLEYASCVSAILVKGKLRDNISDEGAVKRTLACLASPAVSAMVKRASKHASHRTAELSVITEEKLAALAKLEKESCPSLDSTAEVFGELTGELFAAGLSGAEERICRLLGHTVGRFIYVCDAADDILEDKKKGRYNPILYLYGESATITKANGTEPCLSESVAESILTAALLDLDRAASAAELICDSALPETRDIAEIVRNILYMGMPEILRSILRRRCGMEESTPQ